jgi:hypothetical protein
MNSRERVTLALNHREPDRVPLDLGATSVSGMHVSSVYQLRQGLGLDAPGAPVKVIEMTQMLGEIAPDLLDAVGADAVGLRSPTTSFGFRLEGWKPWTTFDGTPVLVPSLFNTDPEPNGDLLMYPGGDTSAPPSGRMPNGGWYFDAIVRQPPIVEEELRVEDNLEEFGPISDEMLAYFAQEADRLWTETDRAVVASFGGTGFGDIARVPAPALKYPKGIRDIEEWYVSAVSRKDFIYRIFEGQCEIALRNLEKIHHVVGEKVTAINVTGTDFGTQHGPFISRKTYRDLYRPFHKAVNDWVHANTTWKTFMHSCGGVFPLIPDFIEAGFDILNPVQCSAAGMDPLALKRTYGDQVVFWGGGVDTQDALPFGTPDEVFAQVRERLKIFGAGGGYVFNPVHNVQARTPTENLLALYRSFKENGACPF